ncbi:MAG: Txe/YoeB family addiction module toxin [Ginsengibacter sp.]
MRSISLTAEAITHLEEWRQSDPKVLAKIVSLLAETAKYPFEGIGKPEPLKHNLKGKWSRRINQEHRLVYEVKDDAIIVFSCRYHY